MNFCNTCILPDTRPNLVIDEHGVCNACRNFTQKTNDIDWQEREQLFSNLVNEVKSNNSSSYDCVIPVSGGKDSTWQVIKCLEYGLHPLAVTWAPPGRSRIGQKNLNNLISLGVDHIDFSINPDVEKKFMLKALQKYGATAVPMHMAMHSIPVNIACLYNIPLIVWGENSALEYGSSDQTFADSFFLDSKWRKRFGVTHGTIAKDWVSEDLTEKDLTPYFCPSDEELSIKNIRAIFLGSFFKWDVEESLRVAKEQGFLVRESGPKVGLYNYTDIDDDFISIHHYLKWYKFGFTRLFDNLSLEIRNGRVSRDEALGILADLGSQRPDDDIEKLCDFLNISKKDFEDIIEKFRNRSLWKKNNGYWMIENFIIKNWRWNEVS